jgi:hypothetical protein
MRYLANADAIFIDFKKPLIFDFLNTRIFFDAVFPDPDPINYLTAPGSDPHPVKLL